MGFGDQDLGDLAGQFVPPFPDGLGHSFQGRGFRSQVSFDLIQPLVKHFVQPLPGGAAFLFQSLLAPRFRERLCHFIFLLLGFDPLSYHKRRLCATGNNRVMLPVEMHQAHMMQRGILSSEVVTHLARTNRQMWAVTNQGNLVSRTGVSVVARSLGPLWKNVAALPEGVKPDQVRFIQGDPAGRIWVVARGGLSDRLFYYDIPGKAWVDCPEVANLVPSGTINAMAVDQTGRAYFSTRWHGIVVFDGQKWTPHPINEYLPHVPLLWLPHDPSETVSQEETQLPAGVATLSSQVFCDREDHLWIGAGVYLMKCPARWTGEILGEGPAR